jgi:hypothetical protein
VFAAGQCVRVVKASPPGHVRTPFYVRGKSGVVMTVVGEFDNPEELAYARPGRKARLYRVRFKIGEVFANAPTPADEVDVEIFEHWLEEA